MILLSAHIDTVQAYNPLQYRDNVLTGLLDNWLGVFLLHSQPFNLRLQFFDFLVIEAGYLNVKRPCIKLL